MIENWHERTLAVPPPAVGALVDSLSSAEDKLWPTDRWPSMVLDQGLTVGARGGHGPIRYDVETYVPGRHVRFRFRSPRGFDGYHEYLVEADGAGGTVLRHRLVMATHGMARLSWAMLYRPLHDALIEDSLDRAALSLGLPLPARHEWSVYVKVLRAILAAVTGQRRRVPSARSPRPSRPSPS